MRPFSFRKVVVCMTEGSKIVIDACEAFLISMLLPPPTSSSASAASAAVTDRYHTPSPFGSGYQTPFDDAPPVPPKIISILQVFVSAARWLPRLFSLLRNFRRKQTKSPPSSSNSAGRPSTCSSPTCCRAASLATNLLTCGCALAQKPHTRCFCAACGIQKDRGRST